MTTNSKIRISREMVVKCSNFPAQRFDNHFGTENPATIRKTGPF